MIAELQSLGSGFLPPVSIPTASDILEKIKRGRAALHKVQSA
jgi:hypothetical protein